MTAHPVLETESFEMKGKNFWKASDFQTFVRFLLRTTHLAVIFVFTFECF